MTTGASGKNRIRVKKVGDVAVIGSNNVQGMTMGECGRGQGGHDPWRREVKEL